LSQGIDLEQLVSIYWNMKVKKVSPFGPVWKVKTPEGYFCLKCCKHGVSHLLFAYHVIEGLWQNGFRATPRLIPTYAGIPFINTLQGPFVFMKWVGRPLKNKSKTEWVRAAKVLAHFHIAFQRIKIPHPVTKYYFSGRWLKRYPKRIWEMKQAFNLFSSPQNELEVRAGQDRELIMDTAERALKILRESEYSGMVQKLYTRPALSHGNIKAKNFTVTADGIINIIDFDSFRLDLPIQDFCYLFSGALESTGWSRPFARELFKSYNSIREIRREEIPILQALLLFPQEPYKLIHKYLKGERSWEKLLRKWNKVIPRFIEEQEFYQDWFSMYKKE